MECSSEQQDRLRLMTRGAVNSFIFGQLRHLESCSSSKEIITCHETLVREVMGDGGCMDTAEILRECSRLRRAAFAYLSDVNLVLMYRLSD